MQIGVRPPFSPSKSSKPLRLALRHEVLDRDPRHRTDERHLKAFGVKSVVRDRLGWPTVQNRPGRAVTLPHCVDVIGPTGPFRVRPGNRPGNAAVRAYSTGRGTRKRK